MIKAGDKVNVVDHPTIGNPQTVWTVRQVFGERTALVAYRSVNLVVPLANLRQATPGSMDEEVVFANCRIAQREEREIDDATARVIASWYCGGEMSVSYEFVSTGSIRGGDASALWGQLADQQYRTCDSDHRLALDMLGTYLLNRKNHGPVPGWSELWVR